MATINRPAGVAGMALYLECRYGTHTQQILLTPEGMSASGAYTPMTCYRRMISADHPRRTWKQQSAATSTLPEDLSTFTAGIDQFIGSRLLFTNGLLTQVMVSKFEVYNKPFAVEVTPADLDDVRAGKTPYKVLDRVLRGRRELGYSESLLND